MSQFPFDPDDLTCPEAALMLTWPVLAAMATATAGLITVGVCRLTCGSSSATTTTSSNDTSQTAQQETSDTSSDGSEGSSTEVTETPENDDIVDQAPKKKRKRRRKKKKKDQDQPPTAQSENKASEAGPSDGLDRQDDKGKQEEDATNSNDDGWIQTGGSPQQRAEKKAAKEQRRKEKQERIDGIEAGLSNRARKWRDSRTTVGTQNRYGTGSSQEHDLEDQAKQQLKDGDVDGAIDSLEDAIAGRYDTLGSKSSAGYAGHLGWINKLENIKSDLESLDV